MSNTYKPKYLKQDPPTPWEQQNEEVFAMVNSNPHRRANVDNMVIVMEKGRMFLTYPGHAKADAVAAVFMILVVLLVVILVIAALMAPTIGPRLLSIGTIAVFTVFIIFSMKGEKKNAQH